MASVTVNKSVGPKTLTFHMPCNARPECTHAKHGYKPRKVRGGNTRNRALFWPIGWAGNTK